MNTTQKKFLSTPLSKICILKNVSFLNKSIINILITIYILQFDSYRKTKHRRDLLFFNFQKRIPNHFSKLKTLKQRYKLLTAFNECKYF